MKRESPFVEHSFTSQSAVRVDHKGQRYFTCPNGQLCRLLNEGKLIRGIKLSKKERLNLRRESNKLLYGEAFPNMSQTDQIQVLANKILETPVVTPQNDNAAG